MLLDIFNMFFLIDHESWQVFSALLKVRAKAKGGHDWHLSHLRMMYPFVQFLKCHCFF